MIVALLGVPGSGKSVIARRLHDEHGFGRVRFGDPLRDMLRAGFQLTDEEIDGDASRHGQARFGGCTPHHMIVTLANQWARASVHTNLLCTEWRRRVDRLGGLILTDDLQRANEAEAVRDAGGIVVRVTRPGYRPMDNNSLARQSAIHSDIEIVNHKVDDLNSQTDRIVSIIRTAVGKRDAA